MSLTYPSILVLLLVASCGGSPRQPEAARPAEPADSLPHTESAESAAKVELAAFSTIGWTAVPPFRREECGVDQADGEEPTRCFFFTRSARPGEEWDPAQVTGLYTLRGHWRAETLTGVDWVKEQGQTPREGTDSATRFPVFEIDSYCLAGADADRVIGEVRSGDRDGGQGLVAWLEAHRCKTGG